jgi:hypothetical protein
MSRLRTLAFSFAFSLVSGCAAWRTFTNDVAPAACAAIGAAFEQRGCDAHTAAGIPETDPRAAALHATGHALDVLAAQPGAGDAASLAAALRAFEAALEEVTPGAGALSISDGGPPTDPTFPDPAKPSPTLPLPPPAALANW